MTDARRHRPVGNDRVAAVEKVAQAMHETVAAELGPMNITVQVVDD